VLAQFQEDLVFPGYEQDKWVAAQKYQSASWVSLVQLWKLYNLHSYAGYNLRIVIEEIEDMLRLP
jgi:hypothetical protein